MKKKAINYTFKVNKVMGQSPNFDTTAVFEATHEDTAVSAIDKFSQKTMELRMLQGDFTELTDKKKETISNLLVLGFISAVESYLREIIRHIILVDNKAKEACLSLPVSYGAATAYSEAHLPEAILESYSFICSNNIEKAIKELLGIKGNVPDNVKTSLSAYDKICQIRHCIVHRYGKLGSRNAISLGLDSHSSFLEKPVRIKLEELQNIITICHATAYDINNFLFRKVLVRTAEESTVNWSWDLRTDKKPFKLYFDIFLATGDAEPESTELKSAYFEFKNAVALSREI